MKSTIRARHLIIIAAVMLLWNTFLIKPLKIFTVFLHELGHAFMAFIFGYGITDLNINLNESGYTVVMAKNWFSSLMITSGGYLGSLFFALLILILRKTFLKKYILGVVASVFLFVSVLFSGLSFALAYSVMFAIAVLIIYMLQKEKLTDWSVDILGVTGVVYAIYDTFVDTILVEINSWTGLIGGWSRASHMTDAVRMAEITGIPAIVWGIIWLAVAIFAARAVLREKKNVWRRRRYAGK